MIYIRIISHTPYIEREKVTKPDMFDSTMGMGLELNNTGVCITKILS